MASANKELREKGLGERAFSGRLGIERGSALILVVVLTSLLAIVGVMFLMVSRMDRMATSGISEDKQLDLAVDTVVGKICGQLVWDVPGTVIPDSMIFPLGMIFPEGVILYYDGVKRPEYHDYPGPEDRWLAASEPNNAKTWPQISDVTGYIARMGWPTRNVPIAIVPDHRPIVVDPLTGSLADADGDGVADAKWFMLEGVTSSRGEPIYAAVRVTDNGGRINVNTAFVFDPGSTDVNSIDGTSPLQINLMALANRPRAPLTPAGAAADERALLWARANGGVSLDPCDLAMYEDQVIWRYDELTMPYTPFDISDELELRNRFLLNQRDIDARIERLGWVGSFLNNYTLEVPIGQGGSGSGTDDWFARANESVGRTISDPTKNPYDYRHIATTYSMDRIINPLGAKMTNINTADQFELMGAIENGILDANPTMLPIDVEKLAGQLAANIKDFRDDDSDVTTVWDPNGSGMRYYGYERPCIYISEVTGIETTSSSGTTTYRSYAVELHRPYFEDAPCTTGDWQLVIDSNGVTNTVNVNWTGSNRYHVIFFRQDPNTLEPVDFDDPDELIYQAAVPGHQIVASPSAQNQDANYVSLEGATISLQRSAPFAFPTGFITVDSYNVPSGWLTTGARSYRRDISQHKCIRRLWEGSTSTSVTLGKANGYVDPDSAIVQAHPYLDPNAYTSGFKNVGEIGMVFDVNAYNYNAPDGSIDEADLRLDLQKNQYARILNYLTVFDPTTDGRDSNGDGRTESLSSPDPYEIKVPGRININTAPPFVLEQLPWVAPPPARDPAIANAIAGYRDGVVKGFRSISELLWVPEMAFYRDGAPGDQVGFPDLTPLKLLGAGDGAADDIEERDLIFHRISNLVTVRSDVFTAYILVRIGANGPQRRVVAILDRSGVVPISSPPYTTGRVNIRALHRMADAW